MVSPEARKRYRESGSNLDIRQTQTFQGLDIANPAPIPELGSPKAASGAEQPNSIDIPSPLKFILVNEPLEGPTEEQRKLVRTQVARDNYKKKKWVPPRSTAPLRPKPSQREKSDQLASAPSTSGTSIASGLPEPPAYNVQSSRYTLQASDLDLGSHASVTLNLARSRPPNITGQEKIESCMMSASDLLSSWPSSTSAASSRGGFLPPSELPEYERLQYHTSKQLCCWEMF